MERITATVAADGRIVFDQPEELRLLQPDEKPPRQSVAYAIVSGQMWEAGCGILRGSVGEKRPDKSRLLTLALERVSVLRSSCAGKCLELNAGDAVSVIYLTEPGHVAQQIEAICKANGLVAIVQTQPALVDTPEPLTTE